MLGFTHAVRDILPNMSHNSSQFPQRARAMPHAAVADIDARDRSGAASRIWHAALYVLLVLTFVTGGSSQEHGWTDVAAELLALPILLVGFMRWSSLPRSHVCMLGVMAITAIALLPWLQLLPLGQDAWSFAYARDALASDLAVAGVDSPVTTWSLAPAATLRGALMVLPALALFVGVLGVDTRTQRRLLVVCVALPLASLLLGFLQLGASQDSLLNPYPQWAPAMNGLFANPNHQGTAMLVGLAVCLSFAVGTFGTRDGDTGRALNPWPAVIAGAFLLFGLPLTNSRAAAVIGVLLLIAAPLLMAGTALRRSGHGRHSGALLLLAAVIAAIGLYAAMGWMKVDEIEEVRWLMRQATAAQAATHLPWGSGIGSFVAVFQQALPDALVMPNYVNAAHNDFAQVWLEAGLAGFVVAALVLVAVASAFVDRFRGEGDNRRILWAALLGLIALLAHSFADYPLRTPALLAVAMLLAGIIFAQHHNIEPHR